MNSEQMAYLRAENDALKKEIARLNQELLTRAGPVVAELQDGLAGLCRMAAAGSPHAKAALKQFAGVIEEAMRLGSDIQIVRTN